VNSAGCFLAGFVLLIAPLESVGPRITAGILLIVIGFLLLLGEAAGAEAAAEEEKKFKPVRPARRPVQVKSHVRFK
jgi:hypothetical protein